MFYTIILTLFNHETDALPKHSANVDQLPLAKQLVLSEKTCSLYHQPILQETCHTEL